MATIGPVNFAIELEGGSAALLQGSWTIDFDAFDQGSDLTYSEIVRLVKDDTGVGDVGNGGDEFLTLRSRTVQANGTGSLARSIDFPTETDRLNEDPSFLQPRDELRLIVELIPRVQRQRRESNLVTGRFV